MKRAERAERILEVLKRAYPEVECALHHENAYELLAATILSAQCTDERVNMVTPNLFRAYPRARDLAEAELDDVIAIIRSTGFFNNKAKSLIGMASRVTEEYGGTVPDTMDDLLTLPGVARKTANVLLGTWFRHNVGVVVDTHVGRLARRMGLTRQTDPVRVERDLMKVFPQEEWTDLSHRLIAHGRTICDARLPRCGECPVGEALCPAYEPELAKWRKQTAKKKPAKKKPAKKKPARGKSAR